MAESGTREARRPLRERERGRCMTERKKGEEMNLMRMSSCSQIHVHTNTHMFESICRSWLQEAMNFWFFQDIVEILQVITRKRLFRQCHGTFVINSCLLIYHRVSPVARDLVIITFFCLFYTKNGYVAAWAMFRPTLLTPSALMQGWGLEVFCTLFSFR